MKSPTVVEFRSPVTLLVLAVIVVVAGSAIAYSQTPQSPAPARTGDTQQPEDPGTTPPDGPSSGAGGSLATESDPGQPAPVPSAAQVTADEEDMRPQRAQPDFTLVNLPTTLPLPLHKSNFRVTHRFARDWRRGTFGDLVGDLFGLDNGAVIGLEYRFAPVRRLEAVIYRSSLAKTIQFMGKYDGWSQSETMPVSLSVMVSAEGENNFRKRYQPGLGVVVSRKIGDTAALYISPMWIHNSNSLEDVSGIDHDTLYLGLGGRVRIRPTTYFTAEVSPRLSGFAPGKAEWAFAIEKRAGGHMFQLNFSNSFATTVGGLARGGSAHDVYLGFNITRKFF